MSRFELRRHDGQAAALMMEQLADAYMEGYADDPDVGHSIYARDAFVDRTSRQASAPGFVLITAHAGDQWAGFSFGMHFPAGRWWAGDWEDVPPQDLLKAEKFAVIELVVLPAARGVGLATELMSAVLADRPEPWATLLADQEGKARSMYDRWGWKRTGVIQPAPDVPPLDVLVRSIGGADTGNR
jgi:GNAT superfamily N-acetyltransferase